MKRQWKKFLKEYEKKRKFGGEVLCIAVAWLATYLYKSIKKGNDKDVVAILETLKVKHGIGLNEKGELYFLEDK